MTELSFLIDLLLNHKLQKVTKDAIAERIKVMSTTQVMIKSGTGISPEQISNQSPSTRAILERNPDLVVPVAVIAQTPAAAAALNSRQEAISKSMSGTIEKGRTSPRKF